VTAAALNIILLPLGDYVTELSEQSIGSLVQKVSLKRQVMQIKANHWLSIFTNVLNISQLITFEVW